MSIKDRTAMNEESTARYNQAVKDVRDTVFEMTQLLFALPRNFHPMVLAQIEHEAVLRTYAERPKKEAPVKRTEETRSDANAQVLDPVDNPYWPGTPVRISLEEYLSLQRRAHWNSALKEGEINPATIAERERQDRVAVNAELARLRARFSGGTVSSVEPPADGIVQPEQHVLSPEVLFSPGFGGRESDVAGVGGMQVPSHDGKGTAILSEQRPLD